FIYEEPVAQLRLERARRWSETVRNACEIPTTFNDIRFYLNMADIGSVSWFRLSFSQSTFRKMVRQVLRAVRLETWLRPPGYVFVITAADTGHSPTEEGKPIVCSV